MQCREVVEPEVFAPVFTSGPPIPEHTKGKSQQGDAGASSSHAPAPKKSNRSGISKFFQTMFSTYCDARAYNHEARELAKEGRHIQNVDRRAAGLTTKLIILPWLLLILWISPCHPSLMMISTLEIQLPMVLMMRMRTMTLYWARGAR